MKITAVETLSLAEFPNVLWVEVTTDSGLVGLGETFYGATAVAAYIHETAASMLLGQDALALEKHARTLLAPYCGQRSSGVEIRAASALDLALWDIFGQATGQPLHQLLGGRTRNHVRVYNTCAGYRYVRDRQVVDRANWGLGGAQGPYEDLEAFLNTPEALAESLLAEGYTGMKIWPFDVYAEASGGLDITAADLKKGVSVFERIRARVGDAIDLHVELHGLWSLPAARKIARALEPVSPYWYEDPVPAANIAALAEFRAATPVWTTASETLGTRWAFRELLEARATDVVMLDIGWCGGIGEAKKIATLAEAYQRPVAPHDCTGPVLLTAAVHLSVSAPNALVQEVVRAFYHGWYRELVTDLPRLEGGYIWPTEAPGLGTRLQPGLKDRPDARRQRTAL